MSNNKTDSPLGIGIITIFMILIVLCLSTFATLTFFSARADLRLSRVNADTVSAYYEADTYATELAAKFAEGSEEELVETIPMTDMQSLYIHLLRKSDGTVSILAWQTVSADGGQDLEEPPLPVWDGETPN